MLISHGHGPSLYIPSKDGYAPLRDFYASHGFVVVQPTHLNSKVAGLPPNSEGGPLFWQSRAKDMMAIIDRLDEIEKKSTFLTGRLNKEAITLVGHSLGAQTASLLLGAKVSSRSTGETTDLSDSRIKAGVLLGAPGSSNDEDLTEVARTKYDFPKIDFTTMTTPTLVIYGDQDTSAHLTTRGAQWHTDPFHKSQGDKSLLTLFGAHHGCGGIAGYDAKETDDEDPERMAIVQRMTLAYLQSRLNIGDSTWERCCSSLLQHCHEHAKVENRL